jgi:glycosyltransferase involved in cell wall biosynthesis
LRDTVESLYHAIQGVDDRVELIVIDNGSTDHTSAVTDEMAYRENCFVFREDVPGLLAGRHRGVAESHSEILIFVDDDIRPSKTWLRSIINAFEDPKTHLVGGPSVAKFERAPPEWISRMWTVPHSGIRALGDLSLIQVQTATPIEIDPGYVWGLNYSIRRNTLIKLGGFHPDCVPGSLQHFQGDGESGLSAKIRELKLTTIFHPSALVEHIIGEDRLTVEYFEQRRFYQGVCNSYSELRRKLREPVPPTESSLITRCKFLAKRIGRRLRLAFGQSPKSCDEIGLRLAAAQRRGYAFHQECVRRSAALGDWVARTSYMEYEYPVLEPDFQAPIRQVHLEAP